LRLVSLAGAPYCEFRVGPQAKIRSIKHRAMVVCGVPVREQRLVYAGRVLRDEETMESAGVVASAHSIGEGMAVTLQCVRIGRSSRAQGYQASSSAGSPDVVLGAALADIIDASARAEHERSERLRPRDAAQLSLAICPATRAMLISWMVQGFSLIRFDEGILHSVILSFDRYCALERAPVDVGSLQQLVLAIVSTELKLAGAAEFPACQRRRVLAHLAQGHVDEPTILETERAVLVRLGFGVGVPTPLSFLRELTMRPRGKDLDGVVTALALELAIFFLGLCLFEPAMEYGRFPQCVLAGAALSGALRVLEEDPSRAGACAHMREDLQQDLASYGAHSLEACMAECEEAILELWSAQAGGRGAASWRQFYPNVVEKFTRSSRRLGNVSLCAVTADTALQRFREERR